MAGTESKAEGAKLASIKVVAYIGTSDIRSISVADWDASDIKGENRLWSAHNGWQIPFDKFNDDELNYLSTDPEFVVKDAAIPDIKAKVVRSPEWNSD